MKKWLQNLSGAVMASLLAITLNGKAYADVEEQILPAEAPMEIVEAAPAPISAVAPEPVPAPVSAPAPVVEAASASAPAPSPEPAQAAPVAVKTAPVAAPETLVAEPKAAMAVPEMPSAVEASVVVETTVVAESAQPSEQVALPETPAVVETHVYGEMTAAEMPLVDFVTLEKPAETATETSDTVVETRNAEEEKTVESEAAAVKKEEQRTVNEMVVEDGEKPVLDAAESNVSSDVSAKMETKELSQTKEETPPVSAKASPVGTLSTQGKTEETDVEVQFEEQPEEQSEEQVKETAKRGAMIGESFDEESKAPATRGTDGEDTNTQTNQNSVFKQNTDGSYVLVNHTGTEALSANSDITVLAAGFNRIGSISGNGTVTIAGTGILLVDSLQGNLELLTFTDMYEQGSVAVFVKDGDRYVLANGSTPGILDEQYKITDATLVMPANTSLLLCGTGAVPKSDGSCMVYYHASEASSLNTNDINKADAVESIGKLTIAQQAALIVEKGATIVLENLKSLGGSIRHPEITVEDGGGITVEADGSVGNAGYVTIDGNLSGSGSVTADKIIVNNPASINDSQVTLSSPNIYLNGSGTIKKLSIHDSTVIQGNDIVSISGLVSSGNSAMSVLAGSSLQISKVDGTLSLNSGHAGEVTVSGNMAGSGTISFNTGSYILPVGTKLNNVHVSDDAWGDVYDYARVLEKSYTPLHIEPEDVSTPSTDNAVIPVAGAALSFVDDDLRSSQFFAEKSITAVQPEGSNTWELKQEDIRALIDDYQTRYSCSWSVSIQILHLNEIEGKQVLSLTNYSMDTPVISAGDICLVRILFIDAQATPEPNSAGSQTSTLYTGSGILGGSGAGSVHIGRPKQNENNPDSTSVPNPDPQPTLDLTPLVATAEEAPAEAPLVWVEAAPIVNNEAASPTEKQYVLLALEGEKTLEELGGKATVAMNYTPPAEYAGKTLYVVFRNEDGTLTAFRATYSDITGLLRFITDRLGTFMVVGFDFDGVEFSEEFYEALAQIPELKDLVFAEYSPV